MVIKMMISAVALLASMFTIRCHALDDEWMLTPPDDLGQPRENMAGLKTDQAMVHLNLSSAPEEVGLILIDGDIYLTKDMYKAINGTHRSHSRSKRTAVRDKNLRWPDGELRYTISSSDFNDWEKYLIHRAMTEWERYTCFRFRPKNRTTRYWTHIQNGPGGCNAALGFIRHRPQYINLHKHGCRYKGLYLHELGHAIGLIHVHQRPDRDKWITIYQRNVDRNMKHAFTTYSNEVVDTMGMPYDYGSIMHYSISAFSKNGKSQTIRPKFPTKDYEMAAVISKELAYSDVEIVNKMYKCAAHCPDNKKCGSDGHLDENCNCICKDGSSDCDTSKKKEDKNCKNTSHSWLCYIWANQGECDRNMFYMKKTCPKACGFCGPKSPTPSTCKDLYRNSKCEVWAERGDCITNFSWMKRNCPKACKLCSKEEAKPSEKCLNKYKIGTLCEDKAREGDCKIDPIGMYNQCRRACRWCDKHLGSVMGSVRRAKWYGKAVPCLDKNRHCAYWARNRQCEVNPNYMHDDCAKSCKKCDDGTCKNLYSDTECDKFAKNGDCLTNLRWMRYRCAFSCRLGVCSGIGNSTTTQRPKNTTHRPTRKPLTSTRPARKYMATARPTRYPLTSTQTSRINPTTARPTRYPLTSTRPERKDSTTAQTTHRPLTTTTSKPIDTRCYDQSGERSCKSWKRVGFCLREFAAIKCKKTCRYCGCKELYKSCPDWAAKGDCRTNTSFMLRYCQKSCKLC